MNITVQHHDRQIGPYTLDEVNRRLREGKLKPDALAWQEGTKDWVPLKTIPGVGGAVSASPAAKPQVVKQKSYQKPLVWCGAGFAVLLLIDISIRSGAFKNRNLAETTPAQTELFSGSSIKREPTTVSDSKNVPAKPKPAPVNMRGNIQQVLPEGVFVRCRDSYQVNNSDQTDGFNMGVTDEYCYLTGDPRQHEFTDGQFVGVIVQRAGNVSYGSRTLPWYEWVRNASSRTR